MADDSFHRSPLARTDLHRRLVGSARNFLAKLQRSPEQVYGFGLLLSPGGDHSVAAAVTEEGLTRAVQRFARLMKLEVRSEVDWADLRQSMRWSGPGDGWYVQCQADLTEIKRWFAIALEARELVNTPGHVQELCLGVLRDLETQGAFGNEEVRSGIVLGLWDPAFNEEEFLRTAEMLNPPAVVVRLRNELQQMNAAQRRRWPS